MDLQPLYRAVIVGLVPQPRQIPPAPFSPDQLQRLFTEVGRSYRYQQFSFLPGDGGAQMSNGPEDALMVQPPLVQLRALVTLTPEASRETSMTILRSAAAELELDQFLQAGIKVIAHVPAPGDTDAKAFVEEQLMRAGGRAKLLGQDFFAGGVKFRALGESSEANLLIEPLVADPQFIFVDYDVQHHEPFGDLDRLAGWLDEAFSFVRDETMGLLEAG